MNAPGPNYKHKKYSRRSVDYISWQESQFLVQLFNRGEEGNIDEIVKLLDEERDDV